MALRQQVGATSTVLSRLREAVAAEGTAFDAASTAGWDFISQVRASGFTPAERRSLLNQGLDLTAISRLETEVRDIRYPSPSASDLQTRLNAVVSAHAGTAAWDLDADGAFDDASGERPVVSFPTQGSRVVGVVPATKWAELVGLRIHDLRHTAVALWIAAGANPKQLATWAGHTSVSVVLDRYGHLFEGHDVDILDRLADRLQPTPTQLRALRKPAGLAETA